MNSCANETVLLSEQLKCFSVVLLNPEAVADALETWLGRYGPVNRVPLSGLSSAVQYLTPFKSFPARFVVLGLQDRALLLGDGRDEHCGVDAFAISRMTGCSALALVLQSRRREFQLYERGEKVREVQSLREESGTWYYREEGELQPFEDLAACVAPKKRDRLSTDALSSYYQRYLGTPLPDWRSAQFTNSIGLKRSTHTFVVPIIEFCTVVDFDVS
jgi:hypothetical protein